MRTKVCLAITKGVWGGAQEYVYTLATSLPKDRFDVFVVCGEGKTLQEKLEKENIRTYNVASLKRDVFFFNEIKTFFVIRKILVKEKPDVLHLNSSKIGGLGGLIGRLLGIKKIVFTAHGWAFNEERFGAFKREIFYRLQWLTIMFSHTTIAVSQKTKRDTESMLHVKHKISIVHNGIKDIEFEPKAEARKYLYELARLSEHTEIIIGTISELHKNKGLDLLIDASRNLPFNASVYIIGDGEEKQNLQEMIDGYDLSHKVFLVGRIPDARKYLKAFDIFTLTSRTEALPYSLLEAGLAECAVIATNVGGIPEVIDSNKNGVLIHRNVHQLEDSLQELIEDPNKRRLLGSSLRQKVLTEFSVEKMIEKTIEIYKQ